MAKRLIDANAYAFPGDLINEPTVDAVEVVRCAQCKYFGQDGSGYYDDEFCCINPSGLDDIVKQSDFCSYGERKEG